MTHAGDECASRAAWPLFVLDGQVYSAPTLQSQIGAQGIITGKFTPAEISYLIRVLAAGSLEASLSRDPVSLQEVAAESSRGPADRPSRELLRLRAFPGDCCRRKRKSRKRYTRMGPTVSPSRSRDASRA